MDSPPTESAPALPRSAPPVLPGLVPVGTPAPSFELRDTPYSMIRLGDLRGRPVVLVFYVADWHPVASDQLTLYQELAPDLERLGASVLGISVDAIWSHAAFARDRSISFPLLADDTPPGSVARAYGIYVPETGRSRRALFVLDGDGVVRWNGVFPDAVNPGLDGVLSALEKIAGPGTPLVDSRRDDAAGRDVA